MPDYKFACRECGQRFPGVASRVGFEMCPACGGVDIAPLRPVSEGWASEKTRGGSLDAEVSTLASCGSRRHG